MSIATSSGNLINNQWLSGDGASFESTSPSDGQIVWSGNESTPAQVASATAAARAAAGPWWDQGQDARIEHIKRYAETVRQRQNDLAELIGREMGKPLWEAKTEAAAVIGKADIAIDALLKRRSTESFDMENITAVTRYRPFGVLAVVGPFNFPAHLPNGHIIPALLAGNTVVFKPSSQTPAVGEWMVERWVESGLPPGVINLVQGNRHAAIALANDPQVDGLLFTGSSGAGKSLHQTFGQWPQKMLALEMGGNNPLIVHQTENLAAAAYTTVQSAYISAGQRCTCARRLILIEGDEAERFTSVLTDMIGRVRVGFWNDEPQAFAGTVINAQQGRKLLAEQQELIAAGAAPLVQMQRQRDCDALLSPGLIDATEVTNRSDEEMFGPILQIIRVSDFEAAIAEANNTAYGLSAGLLSDNRDCYRQFIHQIRAGVVNWNRQTTGASSKLPFGGCGLSGNNRPSGYFAADYCNWPIASLEAEQLVMPESAAPGIEL